ncbi:hypothetical protein [Candidatus Nitrosotenuis cloacae]|uniref:hypothetical protein n=1 Tax=Candidatus Nitrosotenuis cloacae TaxID=1603555 RepID=UPI00227EBA16|nr:hypothetical protein [Candidatus Nitrosotenuis cloacae]
MNRIMLLSCAALLCVCLVSDKAFAKEFTINLKESLTVDSNDKKPQDSKNKDAKKQTKDTKAKVVKKTVKDKGAKKDTNLDKKDPAKKAKPDKAKTAKDIKEKSVKPKPLKTPSKTKHDAAKNSISNVR